MKIRSLLATFIVAMLVMLVGFTGCENAPNSPDSQASISSGDGDVLLKGSSKKKKKNKKKDKKKKKKNNNDRNNDDDDDNGGYNNDDDDDNGGYNNDDDDDNGGTCNPPPPNPCPDSEGCVRGWEYWKNHCECWPEPFTCEGQFCTHIGVTFYQAISTNPCGNWYYLLSRQYVATLLNKSANSGNIPAAIQAAIDRAQAFFHDRSPNTPLTAAEICEVQALLQIFTNFNTGCGGLPPCE